MAPEDGEKPPAKGGGGDSALKDSIQKSLEQKEREQLREMAKRRLEIAREGVESYELSKMGEALQSFMSYIDILERWKKAESGGLSPKHFDRKLDAAEMLLISGVYWELAKIHDRTKKTAVNRKTRTPFHRLYLNKYVDFSKGMPYEALCAETVRRYVKAGKARHVKDFENAHRRFVGNKKCFVATSVSAYLDPSTLPRLQRFRDSILKKDFFGRTLIYFYYQVGGFAALPIYWSPAGIKRKIAFFLDRLAQRLF